MYKDKYLRVFSRQMEAIVLIILKYFSNTRSFKIGEYHSEISAGEYSVTWRVWTTRVLAKIFDGV